MKDFILKRGKNGHKLQPFLPDEKVDRYKDCPVLDYNVLNQNVFFVPFWNSPYYVLSIL